MASPFASAKEFREVMDKVFQIMSDDPQMGPRQVQVLQEVCDVGDAGASAGGISRLIGYDEPNVHLTLQALVRLGFVEKDESTRPHRYRLAPHLSGGGEE